MSIGELDLTEDDVIAGQKIYADKVQARIDQLEAWANVQVAAKAVTKEDDQEIAGTKTFSASPIVPLTPSGPTQAASKGYADSLVTSLVADSDFTPESYAGEQSITFPNGLIIKMGVVSSSSTVTFGDPFPTAIVSVSVSDYTPGGTNTWNSELKAYSIEAITLYKPGHVGEVHWTAIGH